MKFILQSSDAPENCGFTRWVDPAPIDSVQEFIEYLQIKIFDLECEVNHYEELSEGNNEDEDDDTSNVAASQDEPCTIITAFRQGVRDEKMLEKLATHEVESVTTLFSLAAGQWATHEVESVL